LWIPLAITYRKSEGDKNFQKRARKRKQSCPLWGSGLDPCLNEIEESQKGRKE
jgi:hypothetical protein